MLDNIKKVYTDVMFVERYKKISASHSHEDADVKVNKEDVLAILQKLGYSKSKYSSKDKYYMLENYETNQIVGNVYAGINVILRYTEVDLVISIVVDGVGQNGGPFGAVCNKLGFEDMVRRPEFKDIDELQNILEEGLNIYEDIKRELIRIYS